MISCTEARTLIGVHALGGLSGPEETELVRHLAACEACARVHDRQSQVVGLIDLVGPSQAAGLPPETEQRVMNRIAVAHDEGAEAPRAGEGNPRRSARPVVFALAGAAAATAVFAGLLGTGAIGGSDRPREEASATIRLAPTTAGGDAVATVTLIADGAGAKFAVEAGNLPPPKSGERYILWLTDGRDSRSLGPIDVNRRGWGTAVLASAKRPHPGASIQVSVVSSVGSGGYKTVAEGRLPI